LKGIIIDKGLLNGMKLAIFGEAFYCYYIFAGNIIYRQSAGSYCLFVNNDSTSTAKTAAASVLGPGEVEMIPKDP
jgi:hypothetical protein